MGDMSVVINPIFMLILKILDLYSWVVIAAVIVSWLIAFGVINLYNSVVRAIVRVLNALTEPVFSFVRRILPPIAGLDLSPLVVLFGIWFLQYSISWIAVKFFL